MLRFLLWTVVCVLAGAPVGVAVGVWIAGAPGWGVAAGSVLYGLLGVWVLQADIVAPPAPPREVTR